MFCGLHTETGTHISNAVVNYFITTNDIMLADRIKFEVCIVSCKQTFHQGHGFSTQRSMKRDCINTNTYSVLRVTELSTTYYLKSARYH